VRAASSGSAPGGAVRILWHTETVSRVERFDLMHGAWAELVHEWLPGDAAAALQHALGGELAWEQREIVLFGKRILQPRLIAWAGEVPYRYSGQTLEPRDATPTLRSVWSRVVEHTRVAFNHVLVNRYRDGNDSMGMHADDEPELGEHPVVVSVSLGVTRRFVVAPRRGKGSLSLELGPGSLLVMGGTFQDHYRHGLPKVPGLHGERVSLTFRRIV
jgi:alkylated DNA repair dioxygenase AlkB